MIKITSHAALCCIMLVAGLAENFSFLISYGFFGRYDLTLDTRKVLFVPYTTPTLIRNIHATLLEHFPGR